MSSKFAGFSEEDLERIKSSSTETNTVPSLSETAIKKIDRIGAKSRRPINQYKLPILQTQTSDDAIDSIVFEKCKLSLKSPSPTDDISYEDVKLSDDNEINYNTNEIVSAANDTENADINDNTADNNNEEEEEKETAINIENIDHQGVQAFRKESTDLGPDIVRGIGDTENVLAAHRAKLQELQLKQKIMEEQNKKRKEMLAKALADRTKQTEEEVVRLEKIKKELQILDGQFSQDVSVLRKKIDQACLSYSEAEKQYFKIEKEFLQAKINLQKVREKKELLTEHLCALITHNETRKAQKLETLMLELASDKTSNLVGNKSNVNNIQNNANVRTSVSVDPCSDDDEKPVIIDGVDQKSGKIVEFI
ncbi:RAB6-interacting golgin [Achroia grisella]|uniref:RAB6-interacting golgin n=1 Tax=Achroia grisella TaxID=688607 RepID=UPI0027D2DE0E|nr:RAB6-interacting golgin [Achroia grisella]